MGKLAAGETEETVKEERKGLILTGASRGTRFVQEEDEVT